MDAAVSMIPFIMSCRLREEDLTKLWRYRAATPSILSPYARGLPSVLQAMPHQHLLTELAFIKRLLGEWKMAEPIYGLELLDTQYADSSVRDKAVEWVDHLPMDDIIDLLPQLTQVERERDMCVITVMDNFVCCHCSHSNMTATSHQP